jgi:hypothetical protein
MKTPIYFLAHGGRANWCIAQKLVRVKSLSWLNRLKKRRPPRWFFC